MSTSYEPHTLIVLPNVGTHAVDQRVADYIVQLAAENERLRARVTELEQHMMLAADELDACSDDALLCDAIRSVATTTATDQARARSGGLGRREKEEQT